MKELLALITSMLAGLDIRRRWLATVGALGLAITLLYLFELGTGWLYFRNLEKKVALLSQLRSLEEKGIAQSPVLRPIFEQAASDLAARGTSPASWPTLGFTGSTALWKGLSGASLWILFALLGLGGTFGKDSRLAAFLVLGIVAIVLGVIGSILPTVYNPWVNYISFPLLQLVLLIVISGRAQRRKRGAVTPKD